MFLSLNIVLFLSLDTCTEFTWICSLLSCCYSIIFPPSAPLVPYKEFCARTQKHPLVAVQFGMCLPFRSLTLSKYPHRIHPNMLSIPPSHIRDFARYDLHEDNCVCNSVCMIPPYASVSENAHRIHLNMLITVLSFSRWSSIPLALPRPI